MSAAGHAAIQSAQDALQASDLAAAWGALEQARGELTENRELAALWLTLLRASPDRVSMLDEARQVLERWPADPEIVLRACDALIRSAERTAIDTPPPPDGAAALAARAARRCLEAGAGRDAEVEGYLQINLANALRLQRQFEPALQAFARALELAPENGAWWFNLGLLHKARGSFADGLEANRKAQALLGDEKPVLWNIAICALATGQGEQAADALRALGHRVETSASGLPFVADLPPLQVRVASVGSGHGPAQPVPPNAVSFELLWVTPLSPCHGVVSSASYRVSSVDYGDVVLWDGVPVGVGEYEGRKVPRFALLAVLHKGAERRFRFVALQQAPGDVEALGARLPEGSKLFVHRERIEHMCPRCASGEHPGEHRHMPAEAHHLVYGKIVLPADADLSQLRGQLDALLREHTRVQLVMPELLEELGDSAAAGKAHQMWRGLERSAQKASQ